MPGGFSLDAWDAVLFDLDGVLTTTRTIHTAAWRDTFDAFLTGWDHTHGTTSEPFDEQTDYPAHLDGRPGVEGVRGFLRSRGIDLPEGEPDAPPEQDSIWGLGNRKQLLVEDELERNGVEAFPGSVAWVRELREAGVHTAVVSSSRNCRTVLAAAGIDTLFDLTIDGDTVLELGLAGKPAPDAFVEAARRLGVPPERAVVVEDTTSGVEAARAGSFGLVIGVDRDDNAEQLEAAGADRVVADLSELLAAPSDDMHRTGPTEHRLVAASKRIMAATGDYPVDPWRLVESVYNPAYVQQTETLFALGNGYLGMRGTFEEGEPAYQPGTLLNGFHETWPIVYPEQAHGFATTGQTITPAPDGTTIRLMVDDDPITPVTAEVLDFERTLDMRRGVVERCVVYQLADGRRFRVATTRFVSFAQRHLACLRYELTALDDAGAVVISSELRSPSTDGPVTEIDPRRTKTLDGVLHHEADRCDGERVIRAYRTAASRLGVAAGIDHQPGTGLEHAATRVDDGRAHVAFEATLATGQTVTLTKWLAYHFGSDGPDELIARAALTLTEATVAGYTATQAAHEDRVTAFWDRSEVVAEGAPAGQQAFHFSLFSIAQASLRSEGHGVPAKGLTGTGYEGHYFWDTEAYILPFLIHTSPDVARSLLMHRVRMLPSARRRAQQVGLPGALFPWRTINGEEASAFYAAGTAQYHIDADIAYALNQYVSVTGDTDLLFRHGLELLIETARMWTGLGFFSDRRDGHFVINKVTGPDEYSTVVDNNLYTNLMAAENLRLAADAVARARTEAPAELQRVADQLDLQDAEVTTWRRAADQMYVPHDDGAGVHLQDDSFLDQKPWDFVGTPPEKHPLLLHYHPLEIYRHQVIKQADIVFAGVLLPEMFTDDERRRIFEHYDPLTTGDSSLSECIQAIAAADAGKYRTAEEYLIDAAAVDVADTAGNLRDGVHVASAAGTWMALVFGFARYRWRTGTPEFAPILPTRVRRLRIPLRWRGSQLHLDIGPASVTYTVTSGDPVTARHYGEPFTAGRGEPKVFAGQYRTTDHAGTTPMA